MDWFLRFARRLVVGPALSRLRTGGAMANFPLRSVHQCDTCGCGGLLGAAHRPGVLSGKPSGIRLATLTFQRTRDGAVWVLWKLGTYERHWTEPASCIPHTAGAVQCLAPCVPWGRARDLNQVQGCRSIAGTATGSKQTGGVSVLGNGKACAYLKRDIACDMSALQEARL